MSSIVKAKYNYICYRESQSTVGEEFNEGPQMEDSGMKNYQSGKEAMARAQTLIGEAEEAARTIIEEAQSEIEGIKYRAELLGHQEGYKKGFLDGSKEAKKKVEEDLKEIEEMATAMKIERLEAISRHEDEIILLAFELAKKIMRKHIKTDVDALSHMLKEIVKEHEQEEIPVKITMSEYSKVLDLTMDKDVSKKIQKSIKNSKVVMTRGEDKLLIETETGVIDAAITSQLNRLQEAIDGH